MPECMFSHTCCLKELVRARSRAVSGSLHKQQRSLMRQWTYVSIIVAGIISYTIWSIKQASVESNSAEQLFTKELLLRHSRCCLQAGGQFHPADLAAVQSDALE